jgi:ATP-dependent helicase HepA
MNKLLLDANKQLSQWLEKSLPTFGEKWWQERVVDRLTFQQQRLLSERKITALRDFDLASNLRLLDQNWNDLAFDFKLPREARTWLKELQNVRNRWAHAPASGLEIDDAYRDADTLNRVLLLIGASSDLIEKVEAYKATNLQLLAGATSKDAISKKSSVGQSSLSSVLQPSTVDPVNVTEMFKLGQIVCLKSARSNVFPVIEVIASTSAETRYKVFENNQIQTYYESQLAEINVQSEAKTLSTEELSAVLTAAHLSSPSASSLYSLNSGRVRFVPYQYRPVFKIIRSDRPRLLIADEVGVGKTIEAGLIIKELQARNDIKSVLIICPKALVSERKWELEMKRFDETFTPLNGSLLRHCIKESHLSGEWPVQYEKAILPTSLFDAELLFGISKKGKSKDLGLLELDPPPKFDLVIVDEAHHIRNQDTYLHQAVRYFADNAEAVVFLSATPIQLGREDLFTLLNVLRPDLIIDQVSFSHMAEPNRFINAAIQHCRAGQSDWVSQVKEQLYKVISTSWGRSVLTGNPTCQRLSDSITNGLNDDVTRIKTIHMLEELYTFSPLINRTKRSDIGEFTIRKAETKSVEFTPSQRALHDDLLAVIAKILSIVHGDINVKFLMSTVSRQAASCIYGLAPALKGVLHQKLAELEEASDDAHYVDQSLIDLIRPEIDSLISQAENLDPHDPKADDFMKVISEKLGMEKNKVLVFSTYRHTLTYLESKLRAVGVRYGLVHGDIVDEERANLRHRFGLRKDDPNAIDVLLSSEVGCEGLDFQFCDCLVNYDLPWNPMKIEQRIGRIDRYGQDSKAIGIFNFITPGTIDAEIYLRCLNRIGVFQHAIGSNEEILGEVTRELGDIANSFNLNEVEVQSRLQQLSDNKIRLIEEEQRIEAQQGELFGLSLSSASWDKKLKDSRNFWLEPAALAMAVNVYLAKRLNQEGVFLLNEKPLKNLRLSSEARSLLLDDFRRLVKSTDKSYRAWESWLKGSEPNLQVTFSQDCAVEHEDATLISLGHPLVRQATQYLHVADVANVQLSLTSESLPVGGHPFCIYQWTKLGSKKDDEFVVVSSDKMVSDLLMDLLPSCKEASGIKMGNTDVWNGLDKIHHKKWLNSLGNYIEESRQLIEVRIQSLTASHASRKAILERQLMTVTDEKIKRMKSAELARSELDFNSRVSKLHSDIAATDLRTKPVIQGVLEIRRSA